MKAMVIEQYGKVPMKMKEMPEPVFGADQVKVQIKAASINPVDYKVRNGDLKILLDYQFPLIMGNDFSGVVVETGQNVTQFKAGDKVYGRPKKDATGTFAEYIAIDAEDIALMPKNLSFAEAASIPLVGLTSYQAMEKLDVKAGTKVLVQAGSGGVGTFAIQLAKVYDAFVATTVSDKGIELVKELGADEIINYKQQNFKEQLTNYDGVFDTLGGKSLDDSFNILKPGGKVVSVSGIPTAETAEQMNKGWMKKLILTAASAKVRREAKKHQAQYEFLFMKPSGKQLAEITAYIEAGRIKPVIDRTFPFAQAQEAMDYVETGRSKGKVVITME